MVVKTVPRRKKKHLVKHSSFSFLTGDCQIFGFQRCHQRYDRFPADPGLILLIVFLPLGTESLGKMKKKKLAWYHRCALLSPLQTKRLNTNTLFSLVTSCKLEMRKQSSFVFTTVMLRKKRVRVTFQTVIICCFCSCMQKI